VGKWLSALCWERGSGSRSWGSHAGVPSWWAPACSRRSAEVFSTHVIGGVDLTRLNLDKVSAVVMKQLYPQMSQDAKASLSRPKVAPDGSIWLGGTSGMASTGPLAKVKYAIMDTTAGKGGMLAVILVFIGILLFGFRGGSRRRPRTTSF
jgi:hypothetical protein